eukprot:COSAG01_NODE_68856_length_263_cov_0.579268_1_plen_47_part_10
MRMSQSTIVGACSGWAKRASEVAEVQAAAPRVMARMLNQQLGSTMDT